MLRTENSQRNRFLSAKLTPIKRRQNVSWSAVSLEQRILLAGDVGHAVAGIPAAQSDAPDCGVIAPSQLVCNEIASTEIVFLDSDLADVESLIQGVSNDATVVLLDPQNDMIEQVSRQLSKRRGLTAVHLVTHGTSGQMIMNKQVIDSKTLLRRADEIRDWSVSLSKKADILLYGCDVASGQSGTSFLQNLSRLTGADVAGSVDRTGAGTVAGNDTENRTVSINAANWILEQSTGRIETRIAFNTASTISYKHTLNVTINAAGSRGEEIAQLLVDDQVVAQWNVSTTFEEFEYETSESLTADRVKVRFVNDLYQPENGIDRNLVVDNIQIDGQVYESESDTTFSTGTFFSSDGVTPGFGRGETLHANGFFQYGVTEPSGELQFAQRTWNRNAGATTSVDGDALVVGSQGGTGVIWTATEINAGSRYQLTVDGFAEFTLQDGALGIENAYIGVDFFDAWGNEIGEEAFRLRTESRVPSNQNVLDFIVPNETAYATIWIAVEENASFFQSTARLNDLSLTELGSPDTTPPQAIFTADGSTFTEPRSEYSLGVQFTDDVALATTGRIRVTGPNGYDDVPPTVTGQDNGPADQISVFGIRPQNGGDFSPADDGVYTITLLPNTATDTAGNVAPGQILGSFTLAIELPPPDNIAPTVELTTSETTRQDDGRVEFSLVYQDEASGIQLQDGSRRAVVTGPNGFQRAAQPIAGGPAGDNGLWELFYLFPNTDEQLEAGEYIVTLGENTVFDSAGNAAAGGVLGTFLLTV